MTLLWPDLAPPPPPAAHATLRRMSASVAIATGLAASGRQIDLAGLEAAAGMLCAQVLDLSPTEGVALRPMLTALDESVATLIGMLQDRVSPSTERRP